MKEISFFVSGLPRPGGSKTAFCLKKGGVYTGRAIVTDAGGQRTKEWRQDVTAAAFQAMKTADSLPLTGAIELEIIFQIPRPKSHFRPDGFSLKPGSPKHHITRPDAGKLARSTQDAMTSICYRDDGQIIKETHSKVFSGSPGAWITIREIPLKDF